MMQRKGLMRAMLVSVLAVFLAIAFFVSAKAQTTPQSRPLPMEDIYILPNHIIAPPQTTNAITMEHYGVHTTIENNLAKTTIKQSFKNNTGRTLQATYLYPLPQDAQFSTFTLMINGKAVEGKIMEKAEAQQTYFRIVQKFIDPGLLEYADNKTVKVSVAPIFPGETKEVSLSYTQLLAQDGGLYKYQYPFGYNQSGQAIPIKETELSVDLKTDQPLKTIYSPSHKPDIKREGDRQANVDLKLEQATGQDQDFILYFSKDSHDIAVNTLTFKDAPGKDGYFMLTLLAPKQLENQKPLPKDVVVVLDTSGSMSGEKIQQAKQALKYVVSHLNPEDTFNIVQFNTDVSTFRPELMSPTGPNVKAATEYVDKLDADGSTNIEDALKVGFGKLPKNTTNRPGYVIFLTDGEPTVGVTDTKSLLDVAHKANTHNTRLFVFGVGYDVNTELLGKLSDENHGSVAYVEPNENLEVALTSFYKKIEAPVLTNVALNFGNLEVSKTYPREIGDLFAGSEIILLGRYSHGGPSTITLSGKVGNENKTFTYPVHWEAAENTSHTQLPRLWAGRRIGFLLDNIQLNGESEESKTEVIALSKQFGIVTPYTSYLAMEPEADKKEAFDSMAPQRIGAPSGSLYRNAPAPAAPMASMNSLKSKVGQGAVQMQKSLSAMQQQANMADMEAAQQIAGGAGSHMAVTLKTVGSKTFLRSQDGVWTDTAYDEKQQGKPTRITFGSTQYFDLLKAKPELARYFSLGDAVIVVFEGKVYEVVPDKATS